MIFLSWPEEIRDTVKIYPEGRIKRRVQNQANIPRIKLK